MKLFVLASSLFTSALALAIAIPQDTSASSGACLSSDDAEKLVAEYAALQALTASDIGDPTTTAQSILADDFQETSDSLNELIGLPVS